MARISYIYIYIYILYIYIYTYVLEMICYFFFEELKLCVHFQNRPTIKMLLLLYNNAYPCTTYFTMHTLVQRNND